MTQLFLTPTLRADDESITVLSKGTPSPYDGVLLPKDKADSLKNEIIDLNTCNTDKNALNSEIDLYKSNQSLISQQVTLLLNQNKVLIEAKSKEENTSEVKKYIYFGTGILVAALSVYLGSRVTK
jgi:hypothetical protein